MPVQDDVVLRAYLIVVHVEHPARIEPLVEPDELFTRLALVLGGCPSQPLARKGKPAPVVRLRLRRMRKDD